MDELELRDHYEARGSTNSELTASTLEHLEWDSKGPKPEVFLLLALRNLLSPLHEKPLRPG